MKLSTALLSAAMMFERYFVTLVIVTKSQMHN